MAPIIYEMSVPVFIRGLENLDVVLKKAEQHCDEQKIDKEKFLTSKLAEDMKPLPFQIQSASNTAKLSSVRCASIPNDPWEDTETTFPQLHERIAKTIAFVKSVDAQKFEGVEGNAVVMKLPSTELKFTALSYLQTFALPNFFFHSSMAYAILRKEGVPVGKMDFLGASTGQ
ncbi:hypothetical protein LTR62_006646 [Meristemomyces frigidus]|uniref:DUF1993 domain-containing protein n=1 Tax=Meristemomyces frigidus TaxID=1508187 RepID=A0AAN7TH85_9PEZI|nr:hypothetical protein LTR62_006646 [Meristemomyces frigidus]